jgi:hypothetical protein
MKKDRDIIQYIDLCEIDKEENILPNLMTKIVKRIFKLWESDSQEIED